jgi:YesN/AraC family two-component response regulator
VAERFGLAPNHISRLFALEGAVRFNDHLNIVRVNRAKFMLQNYRMSVKEIAANSGYGDAAYFCRVFRKVTGLTPLQYRTGTH